LRSTGNVRESADYRRGAASRPPDRGWRAPASPRLSRFNLMKRCVFSASAAASLPVRGGKTRIIRRFCEPATCRRRIPAGRACRGRRPASRAPRRTSSAAQLNHLRPPARATCPPTRNSPDLDLRKRRFLLGATGVVGGLGAAAAALPFVMSFFPSERAKAAGAPVEVDIGKLEPGQKIDVEWRGKVVWLINRTPEMLATLPKLTAQLADPGSQGSEQPAYAKTRRARSSRRCSSPWASARISAARRRSARTSRRGPRSRLAGRLLLPLPPVEVRPRRRVYKGVPAPINLAIPPHKYLGDTRC